MRTTSRRGTRNALRVPPCRCNGVIQFLIKQDKAAVIRYAALQSKAAAPLLEQYGISPDDALKSFVFIDEGVAYRKSSAALRIASYLPSPYYFLSYCAIIPSFVRDAVYTCVANNRYSLFGKSEDCLIPTRALKARFLDADEWTTRAGGVGPAASAGKDKLQ